MSLMRVKISLAAYIVPEHISLIPKQTWSSQHLQLWKPPQNSPHSSNRPYGDQILYLKAENLPLSKWTSQGFIHITKELVTHDANFFLNIKILLCEESSIRSVHAFCRPPECCHTEVSRRSSHMFLGNRVLECTLFPSSTVPPLMPGHHLPTSPRHLHAFGTVQRREECGIEPRSWFP